MKLASGNVHSYAIKLLSTAFVFFLITSCDKSNVEQETAQDGTTLKIYVGGIEDESMVTQMSSNARNQLTAKATSARQETMMTSGVVDALVSVEENVANAGLEKLRLSSTDIQRGGAGTKAANSPMGSEVKYRILIYDQNNNLIYNKVGNTGADPLIDVYKGWTYKWYAFSINETAGVPDVGPYGKVAKASLTNKDVLYASGTITTAAGANFLNIVFKRKTANIQAKINVRGMFGTIIDGTAVSLADGSSTGNALMTMGDFDPLTGNFSNITAVTASVSGANMKIDNSTEGTAVKIANFYTLNTATIAANSMKVRLSPLKIRLDDNRERSFTSLSYTVSKAVTPAIGARHAATLRLIESPILVKGIYWARTNLIYNASKLDKYRLKSMPGGTNVDTKDQDFWNWMSETPTSPSSNVDACARLYPEGTWKMPDLATWQSIGQPDGKEERMGLFVGADYGFYWNKTASYPSNTAYDDNRLYISFGGYRTTSGSISNSPAGVFLGALASGQCHYWTSTAPNSTQGSSVHSSMSKIAWIFSWGSVTYPNANKNEGRNVRCIRAKNNPTS